MSLCFRAKADEDEGSSPQGEANPGFGCREKIECSAEALRVCQRPHLFLQKINPVYNLAAVTWQVKPQRGDTNLADWRHNRSQQKWALIMLSLWLCCSCCLPVDILNQVGH